MTTSPHEGAIGDEAAEGDYLEQLIDAGPGAQPTGDADLGPRLDANEADVHEQSIDVPLDDEDY